MTADCDRNARFHASLERACALVQELGFRLVDPLAMEGWHIKPSRIVQNPAAEAERLLGSRLVTHQSGPDGLPVTQLLIEEPTQIARELYLGALLDRAEADVVALQEADAPSAWSGRFDHVGFLAESVQHAVLVEFDRYIEAGDLEKTEQRFGEEEEQPHGATADGLPDASQQLLHAESPCGWDVGREVRFVVAARITR